MKNIKFSDFKINENFSEISEEYKEIAIESFNELPDNFDQIVLKLAEKIPMDAAFYMAIGEHTSIDEDSDEEIFEYLNELILEKWPNLEF